ncbi:FAD-dependent oxidoreductase [Nocardioides pocheonensis]|uniref:FAD-dependent oxidoreductase n=1 Tax=Nocardioides pocheonensis TaxID=661485 RepID=A0A3N0GLU6_9ACTN|nr:FAD-dependent oxidoreductase [Nocardioides pocheonensis]RNM13040.1 FAD-dependent oxidoreductase [Nocardioides pocheonensis]
MRVAVLGAGIIGLFCADELILRGHEVTVVDPRPASGASYAAAGMLAPSAEVWHGEEALLALGLRSLDLWPEAAARLGVPLQTTGTLLVGADHGDLQQVERQRALLEKHGREVAVLDRRALRDEEPELGRTVIGGVLLRDDPSVDPRAVLAALLARVPVVPDDPGSADLVVVATGSVLPAPFTSLVRGVRGEIVRARGGSVPARTVRGWVHGEPVYVVPRPSGEVVIGATSEEHDAEPVPTVGGVLRLLRAARELVPGLDRAEVTEVIARDRPATADNLPLVGPSGVDGVVLAAGHFRHGVLLAPLTAQLIADHVETGRIEPGLDPRRLTRAGALR